MPGRRYSGYDEYEGVFGPLGVYGAAEHHVRGSGFPSASRKSSRRHAPSLSTRSSSHSTVESRERYLAARHAKRRLQSFDIDANGDTSDDSEREGDTAPIQAPVAQVPPPLTSQRQVWLPTRNFSFRQRAGKLDMRAIARLDLDRVVATTDIDSIQRHLENLAFADVTLEDVQHYSDAYFLKLFQITQLTLEYLLNVQDSLVTHSESVETQCDALLTECQQLERENSAFATEIASLKTEIRQKQRTLATFEVMLLNASVAQRRSGRAPVDKENAAAEANAIVDSLLGGGATNADEREEGVVADKPVDCVVCGKKFLSPAYLVRHQQRKHQRSKRSGRSPDEAQPHSDSSSSDRSNRSKRSSKRSRPKTAPLPPEVVRALDEKTTLTQQLAQLQEQLRLEKAARDAQAALLEQQQSQLASQVVGNMSQLQNLLLTIEKKQETTKQDVMQYTQATIVRLQNEAANAQALKRSALAASRVGSIESDDDDNARTDRHARAKASSAEREASERHEKQLETMLQVLMKAQTQQQQALDALAQENSKLWSQAAEQRKKPKSKTRHRHDDAAPSLSALLQMAALDAQRFGVDAGDALDHASAPPPAVVRPVERIVVHEDKLVQTDDEGDDASKRPAAPVKASVALEVQTDAVADVKPAPARVVVVDTTAKPVVKERPPPKAVAESKASAPAAKETEVKATAPPPPVPVSAIKPTPVPDPSKRLQHAAQIVGKVARGFLVRRELQNPANWHVCLPLTSLETALSEDEQRQLHERSGGASAREIVVEVDVGMTANELRLHVARALSGRTDDDALGDLDADIPIDYHRVLLHHTETHEELVGDRLIHGLKNRIEVEIVPFFQAAEEHVDSVFAFHSDTTERLRRIRQASVEHENDSVDAPKLQRLVRLQARVRSFLAKRTVAMMRIDRLVDERLRNMREAAAKSRQRSQSSDRRGSSRMELADPVVAQACRQVHERLAAAVHERLGGSSLRVSPEALAQQLETLEQARSKLPQNVQVRIESLQSRLEHLVQTEYDPELAKTRERESDAARTIQSAVHVAIARRRLQTLLGRVRESRAQATGSDGGGDSGGVVDDRHSPAMSPPLSPLSLDASSENKALDEPLESFDDAEIKRLANAYEDGDVRESMAIASSVALDEEPRSSSDLKATDDVLDRHAAAHVPSSGSERSATPALEDLEVAEAKPKTIAPVMRRTKAPPSLTPVARGTEQQARASTPMRHMSETVEPGRSPRPKLQDKEVISPFSKTPLLSRRGGGASSRRGSGYDNAR